VPPLHHLRKVTGEHTEQTQALASNLHGNSVASLSPEVIGNVLIFPVVRIALWDTRWVLGNWLVFSKQHTCGVISEGRTRTGQLRSEPSL
jgi:uncharacterized protein (DUF2062 family)